MAKCIFIVLAVFQLASGQVTLVLRYNFELTEPSHWGAAPPYSTWSNGLMVGSELHLRPVEFIAIVFSFDYAKRIYKKYESTKQYFGGHGYIWRTGLSIRLSTPYILHTRLFLQPGFVLTNQRYANTYYEAQIDWYEPYQGPPIFYATPNPSSRHLASVFRLGAEFDVLTNAGLTSSVAALENQFGGYSFQTSLGVFLAL